jgi:hypothetical protein
MSKKTIIALLVCIISCVCILVIWAILQMANDIGKHDSSIGMISAIDASLMGELQDGNPAIRQTLGDITNGLSLDQIQYDKIIKELVSRGCNLDPPHGWDRNKPLLDPWGSRPIIWCKQLQDGQYAVEVTSKGKDGLLGTADDISTDQRQK